MKLKRFLSAGLGLFVLASVVMLVLNEAGIGRRATTTTHEVATGPGTKLIAYYLHGKVRCATCNDIEKTAKEAVDAGFAEELKRGRIEWRVVNYEAPGNEHYARDFRLAAPCVVLARWEDGELASWKSLPEIWDFIGDKPAFRKFIETSIREQLDGLPPSRAEEPASAPLMSGVDIEWPSSSEAEAEADQGRPQLIDIGSTRCIPCKRMAPILEELRSTYREPFDVVFIDLLENSDAAETYGVSVIPTQVFFDASGQELFRHEGFYSREEILSKWRELGVELDGGTKS